MLRQRDRQFKRMVGLLTLLSAVVLLYIAQLQNRQTSPFTAKGELVSVIDRADGIRVDTAVTLAGIPVGRVSEFSIGRDNRILVVMEIERRYLDKIRADSSATLLRPLFGNSQIDISMGSEGQPQLADGGEIRLGRRAEISDIVADLPELLAKFDTILINLERLSGDLSRADGRFQQSVESLHVGLERFNRVMIDAQQAAAAAARVTSGAQVTLASMDAALAKFDKSADAFARVVEQAGDGLTGLPEIMETMQQTAGDMRAVAAEVRRLSPRLPALVDGSQETLKEAGDVMGAAKKSFLLRPHLPSGGEQRRHEAPRLLPSTGGGQ